MFKKKHLIELIIFFSYMMFAVLWVSGSLFGADFLAQANVITDQSPVKASFFNTAPSYAKVVGSALASTIFIRFGIKKGYALASFLVVITAFLMLFTDVFALLLTWKFIFGLGGAFMIVFFNPIVVQYFDKSELPVVNGINAVAFNVGNTLALYLAVPIAGTLGGWKLAYGVFAIISLIMLVLWLVFGTVKEPVVKEPVVEEKYGLLDALKDPFTWKLAMTYAGLLAFYVSLSFFGPEYGFTQARLIILFGTPGAIIGTIYAKKVNQRRPIIIVSGFMQILTAVLIVIGLVNGITVLVVISAALLGLFQFIPMAALVTLGQEIKQTPQKVAATFSVFWSLAYLVAAIVPTVLIKIGIATSSKIIPTIIIIVISGTFLLGGLILPESNKV